MGNIQAGKDRLNQNFLYHFGSLAKFGKDYSLQCMLKMNIWCYFWERLTVTRWWIARQRQNVGFCRIRSGRNFYGIVRQVTTTVAYSNQVDPSQIQDACVDQNQAIKTTRLTHLSVEFVDDLDRIRKLADFTDLQSIRILYTFGGNSGASLDRLIAHFRPLCDNETIYEICRRNWTTW
ncbi:uncharacterized protein LOC129752886 [Uranotaenia lowii]|nr:uncharacterized protein LOC129752886 [Uranotaenia lowii]